MRPFRRDGSGGGDRTHRCHSYAAFSEEDVEDAKRCAPPGGLEEYAHARGLTFGGRDRVGHVIGIVPPWPEYVFNACRGALAPSRFGVVAHELFEIGFTEGQTRRRLDMDGKFHAEKLRDPRPMRRLIPGVEFLGLAEPKDEPFGAVAAWVPATTVALTVPEAALLPAFTVRPADRLTSSGNPRLAPFGLPGSRLWNRGGLTDVQQDALFAGAAGRALAAIDGDYVELAVTHGQLLVRRNGFVMDAATLDALVAGAVAIAEGLAAVEARGGAPADPDEPLPAPPAPEGRFADTDRWDGTLDMAAEKFELTREDPAALHRAFPRLPVPGRARGVLRGALPGGVDGRFTIHQHGAPGSFWVRAALLLPAGNDAQPTLPGGILHEPTDMYVGVADGIVACWARELTHGRMAVTETTQAGWAAAVALGLAMSPSS